jgi:hypothetical protein
MRLQCDFIATSSDRVEGCGLFGGYCKEGVPGVFCRDHAGEFGVSKKEMAKRKREAAMAKEN